MDGRKTILQITHGFPYPPYGGAQIRDFKMIESLSRDYSVLLLSLSWDPDDMRHVPVMRRYCESVDVVLNWRTKPQRCAAILRGCLARRPMAAYPYYFEEMAVKIRELLATRHIDLIVFDQILVAPYLDVISSDCNTRTVLSLHNVATHQFYSMVRIGRGPGGRAMQFLKAWLMSRMEAKYVGRFDHCIVVSAHDAQLIRSTCPDIALTICENGVDASARRPLRESDCGNSVLFVGTLLYGPNVDAVRYFIRSILPTIVQSIPDLQFYVVGDNPRDELRKEAVDGVVVTGRVEDVAPFYERSKVAVVPLRAGGGTRLKILEAMALGRPVVSTTVGCEGLHVTDGEHLLIADEPGQFAAKVVELLVRPELRERLSLNARRLVEARYDWAIINLELANVYAGIMNGNYKRARR